MTTMQTGEIGSFNHRRRWPSLIVNHKEQDISSLQAQHIIKADTVHCQLNCSLNLLHKPSSTLPENVKACHKDCKFKTYIISEHGIYMPLRIPFCESMHVMC